jgi:uncharacterized tellurite resistance protein B-like protein
MLDKFRALIDRVLPLLDANDRPDDHALHVATAVLLVEVMKADHGIGPAERETVHRALKDKFGLTERAAKEVAEIARETSRTATDFHAFTSVLNDRLEMARKVRLIEWMWEVAYADGHLADHERHLLWRVGDLLHVSQAARIHARQRAEARGAAAG